MATPPKMRQVQSLRSKRAAITAHDSAVKSASKTVVSGNKIKPLVKRAPSASVKAGGRQRRDNHGRFA